MASYRVGIEWDKDRTRRIVDRYSQESGCNPAEHQRIRQVNCTSFASPSPINPISEYLNQDQLQSSSPITSKRKLIGTSSDPPHHVFHEENRRSFRREDREDPSHGMDHKKKRKNSKDMLGHTRIPVARPCIRPLGKREKKKKIAILGREYRQASGSFLFSGLTTCAS